MSRMVPVHFFVLMVTTFIDNDVATIYMYMHVLLVQIFLQSQFHELYLYISLSTTLPVTSLTSHASTQSHVETPSKCLKLQKNILQHQILFLESYAELLESIQIPSSVTFTVIQSLVTFVGVQEYFSLLYGYNSTPALIGC